MIILMVAVSVIFKDNEIIFPEIFAIVIGAWMSKSQPWKAGKGKMLISITVMAVVGVLVVRFIPWQIEYKIIIAFFIAATLLVITKSTFLPIISAGVLPIIMGTESIVYPISVFLLMAFILIIKTLFEKTRIIEINTNPEYEPELKTEVLRWLMIFAIFIPLCLIAVKCNLLFLIAPPLLVAFSECTYIDSPVRKAPIKVWLVTSVCAVIGAYSRFFLMVLLKTPIILVTAIIAAAVILLLTKSKTMFPPAGALSLLPLIIPEKKLLTYPFLIIIGSATFLAFAMLIGKVLEKNTENNRIAVAD